MLSTPPVNIYTKFILPHEEPVLKI